MFITQKQQLLILTCASSSPHRLNGLVGYYRGLSPNLMRVVPATAITFLVYEKTSHFLLQFRSEDTSTTSQDQPNAIQDPTRQPDAGEKADE